MSVCWPVNVPASSRVRHKACRCRPCRRHQVQALRVLPRCHRHRVRARPRHNPRRRALRRVRFLRRRPSLLRTARAVLPKALLRGLSRARNPRTVAEAVALYQPCPAHFPRLPVKAPARVRRIARPAALAKGITLAHQEHPEMPLLSRLPLNRVASLARIVRVRTQVPKPAFPAMSRMAIVAGIVQQVI